MAAQVRHPASKPAPLSLPWDVARLVAAYYTEIPDHGVAAGASPSHNPPDIGGFKYNPLTGGAAGMSSSSATTTCS